MLKAVHCIKHCVFTRFTAKHFKDFSNWIWIWFCLWIFVRNCTLLTSHTLILFIFEIFTCRFFGKTFGFFFNSSIRVVYIGKCFIYFMDNKHIMHNTYTRSSKTQWEYDNGARKKKHYINPWLLTINRWNSLFFCDFIYQAKPFDVHFSSQKFAIQQHSINKHKKKTIISMSV